MSHTPPPARAVRRHRRTSRWLHGAAAVPAATRTRECVQLAKLSACRPLHLANTCALIPRGHGTVLCPALLPSRCAWDTSQVNYKMTPLRPRLELTIRPRSALPTPLLAPRCPWHLPRPAKAPPSREGPGQKGSGLSGRVGSVPITHGRGGLQQPWTGRVHRRGAEFRWTFVYENLTRPTWKIWGRTLENAGQAKVP